MKYTITVDLYPFTGWNVYLYDLRRHEYQYVHDTTLDIPFLQLNYMNEI